MRILLLISGLRTPSSRYRVLAFLPHLRAAGHVCVVAPSFPPKYEWIPWLGFRPSQKLKHAVRRLQAVYARLARFDAVFVEREIFDDPTWSMEERFRRVAPAMILDLDDGVFLRYPDKFDRLCEMADLLIAGNRFIEERLAANAKRTIVVPTCVDTDIYRPADASHAESREGSAPVLGWIGSTSNVAYLERIAPALRTIAKRRKFVLRIVSGSDEPLAALDLEGVDLQFAKWDPKREVEELRTFDVGLMPLAGDEWDRYKCGFKLLQYMSVGVPGVATPIGVNAEIVRHGENGFLAQTEDDWETTIERLLLNAPLRRAMGRAARETVVERYSIAVHFPRWEEAIREAVENARRRP